MKNNIIYVFVTLYLLKCIIIIFKYFGTKLIYLIIILQDYSSAMENEENNDSN